MTQFKSKSGLSIDFDDVEKMLERIRQWNIPDPTNSERRLSTPQYVSAFAKELTSSIKQSFNNSSVGLFDYPVLMAADILLYDTDVVPVGKDQLQHIELARTLARRFNERFGETLVIPEGKISKEGALIMGLDDPSKKMSKSAPSEYNYIALSDTPDQVRRKIMKAVTDSGSEIAYGDEKPALKNLINIYSLLSDETPEAIISKFSGKGYGDFKKDLAEVVVAFLAPLQERVAALSDEEVLKTLAEGREKIRKVAEKKMREVSEKVGLMPY
jgi:tryptophanyl-tRNA synthetase